MPSFYNTACRVNAKLAFYQRDLQVSVLDENLSFYKPDSNDIQLTLPKSIMNENVAVNYRTIYNGYPTYSKINEHDFTIYSDYLKCQSNDEFYNMFLQDKQNPTYKNILKYYSSKTFDPYGLAAYRMQDFIYLKYYNQIPNNYMITLRRYTLPCEDHMFGLDMNSVDVNHLNGYNESHINIATAGTYMGDKTGNKLSDILKFEYGANYEEKVAKVEMLQNTDGGLAAQMSDRFGVDGKFMTGEQSFGEIVAGGIGKALQNALTFSAATQGKGQDVAGAQTASKRFKGNEWAQVYGENIYGDVNVIDRLKIRSRGLTFNGDFTLNFEYSLKSLKCVNPRVAMMDILTNFLILTGNYGAFWGGETRFYGQRTIAPQYGDTASLRDGDYKSYFKSVINDVRQAWPNITTANGGDGSFWSGLKNLAGGAVKGLFGNLLGGNVGVAGQAQAPIALLNGKPTGYWHVTIGNPLDPIAMIGNLGVTSTTVQFSDALGYDDFPTEVKFTVKLQHFMPRDNAAIENMFNGAKGRIYAFTDYNVLQKFESVKNMNAYQDYKQTSANQNTNIYFDDSGKVTVTGDGRPMTKNMFKIIGTSIGA